ncbi:uncharacterized protein LOC134816458 isoform X2 [Bolinopsis microptera]|uniref:uncharacterized protein LOC134816458 isoform X2 n=1 Tax=Bolinopsis microptera TaxID=2820187 RepID=UPI0030798E93
MQNGLLTVVLSLLIFQAAGYKCNKGTCPAFPGTVFKCCNPHINSGVCCPRDGTCCYHGTSNHCCKAKESCCWDKAKDDVKCCPKGSVCCPDRSRHACCFKTPVFVWILLGICGSVIAALLLLSLYQCIQEEYSEYQSQRVAGNLPSDNSWYYYDYGSTLTRDHRNSSASRQPPEYEPPPSYGSTSNTPGNHGNPSTTANSRAGGNAPKPATPQNTRNNALSMGAESRGTEYHSSTSHVHSSNSDFHSLTSETYSDLQPRPGDEILRTFYEHSVPKLQRMLCSQHQCTVTDGSCVYCMDNISDREEFSELEESSHQEFRNDSQQDDESKNKTQLSDKVNFKSRVSYQNQPKKDILNAHNQQNLLH